MTFVTIDPTRTDADSIGDQSLFDDIRNDLNDLNTRLNAVGSATIEGIHDNFTANVLNIAVTPGAVDYPYAYDTGGGTATILDATTPNPHHALHLRGGYIAASKYKMRFDLDQDHTVFYEIRHKNVTAADATENWGFGFIEETQAAGAAAYTDSVIEFRQGTTGNTYKAYCSKTAGNNVVVADNQGNSANWNILRIEVTFSGATKKVEFFINGSSIGSTTDTAKIPVVRLRPVISTSGGGGARDHVVDYWDADWATRPLEP